MLYAAPADAQVDDEVVTLQHPGSQFFPVFACTVKVNICLTLPLGGGLSLSCICQMGGNHVGGNIPHKG